MQLCPLRLSFFYQSINKRTYLVYCHGKQLISHFAKLGGHLDRCIAKDNY